MSSSLNTHIIQLSQRFFSDFVDWRRHLHRFPELSYEETQTCLFIQQTLMEMGIEDFFTIADTGTVALLHGSDPHTRVIGLRADIDALPIKEENTHDYVSENVGVMHACGHDVHTTCLLGALLILKATQSQWKGTIKAIFQPGEEKNPGGASLIIKEGGLDNPKVQVMLGAHVHTELPVGSFSFREGEVMASADELYITVRGAGGHAAAPHRTTDTIFVAAQIITALQALVSRQNNPFNPSVLSICAISGGHTTNVIPKEVQLKGTFRAMNEEWRMQAHTLMHNIVKHTAQAMGAEADFHIDIGYPTVKNDALLTQKVRQAAVRLVGAEQCHTTELRMGAEDFGYYTREVPSCFYRLGVRPHHKTRIADVHTPLFDVDEKALQYGAAMMAWLATQV